MVRCDLCNGTGELLLWHCLTCQGKCTESGTGAKMCTACDGVGYVPKAANGQWRPFDPQVPEDG